MANRSLQLRETYSSEDFQPQKYQKRQFKKILNFTELVAVDISFKMVFGSI